MLRSLIPLADGIFLFGLCQLAVCMVSIAGTFLSSKLPKPLAPTDYFTIVGGIGVGLIGGLIAIGGYLIRRGRLWQFGLVASGLTLLSPLVVGVPLGAWALWKLTRPEVKAVFSVR